MEKRKRLQLTVRDKAALFLAGTRLSGWRLIASFLCVPLSGQELVHLIASCHPVVAVD